MLLVPKQLRRAGMTGDVPYYGGRFSPAQAYAASHPGRPPGSVPPLAGELGVPLRRPAAPVPAPSAPPASSTGPADTLRALQQLLDAGVITPEEYEGLRARVTG
jgi:Short C-terminal domain